MRSNSEFADDKIAAWLDSFPQTSAEMDIDAVRRAGAETARSMPPEPHVALVHREALPALQVLLYPNTDLTGNQPSMREKATGYGLTAEGIGFFTRQWVPDEAMWSDPRVSPLYARDLSGLPPALIVTAEHDPLRDQGEAYAKRLQEAGVKVRQRREAGLVHSFMRMDQVSPASARAGDRVADEIRALLES